MQTSKRKFWNGTIMLNLTLQDCLLVNFPFYEGNILNIRKIKGLMTQESKWDNNMSENREM